MSQSCRFFLPSLFLTLQLIRLSTPWFTRKSEASCDIGFRYTLFYGESFNGAFPYTDCQDQAEGRGETCTHIYTIMYSVSLMVAVSIAISLLGFCWQLYQLVYSGKTSLPIHKTVWMYGLMLLMALSFFEIVVFASQFPYRAGFCTYCTYTDSGHINYDPCVYSYGYVLTWVEFVFLSLSLCVTIGSLYSTTTTTKPMTLAIVGVEYVDKNDDTSKSFLPSDSSPSEHDGTSSMPVAISVQEQPQASSDNKCCRVAGVCCYFLLSGLFMIIFLIVMVSLYPEDPAQLVCSNFDRDFTDDPKNCPIVDATYFTSVVEDASLVTGAEDRCPSLFCDYTCCTSEAFLVLPDFHSLFSNASRDCDKALTQVECLPCSPLSSDFTIAAYDLTNVDSSGVWPVAVCDSFCKTLYDMCGGEQLSISGTNAMGANCTTNLESNCPTLSQAAEGYGDGVCTKLFNVKDVRNFGFTDQCFASAEKFIDWKLTSLLLPALIASLLF